MRLLYNFSKSERMYNVMAGVKIQDRVKDHRKSFVQFMMSRFDIKRMNECT